MKAETSMVFVFILVAVVIGLMGILAFKWITGLMNTTDDVATVNLINDIKSDANSLRRMRDSSKTFTYEVPSSVEEVCFVRTCDTDCSSVYVTPLYPSIIAYNGQTPQKNLFLLSRQKLVIEAVEMGNVGIPNANSHCFRNLAGQIKLKMIGTGDSVNITLPPNE